MPRSYWQIQQAVREASRLAHQRQTEVDQLLWRASDAERRGDYVLANELRSRAAVLSPK